jgi:hypothetical protein
LRDAKWAHRAIRRGDARRTATIIRGTVPILRYRGRRAAILENQALRVTVLEEGGHIAEVLDKSTGISPLWIPPWPSIEPSTYDRAKHGAFGGGLDAKLLAGIMGHNLCLDIFGGPSAEEAAAGLPVHGEASLVRYEIQRSPTELVLQALLPLANLQVERRIELADQFMRIRESVQNLSGIDRPVGWTEHVTLGPPFLQKGRTEFRASAARSQVFDGQFGPADYLKGGALFDWPLAPRQRGTPVDLRVFNDADSSSAYTAHLMDTGREDAFFLAYSPESKLAFGYAWRRADFPWMGIWEENKSRSQPPWNGVTVTRGMEFGVSPFPETRRAMIERGRLFDVPTFRWIPAATRVTVEYWAALRPAEAIPETLEPPM